MVNVGVMSSQEETSADEDMKDIIKNKIPTTFFFTNTPFRVKRPETISNHLGGDSITAISDSQLSLFVIEHYDVVDE
jgi:hypothetical protein